MSTRALSRGERLVLILNLMLFVAAVILAGGVVIERVRAGEVSPSETPRSVSRTMQVEVAVRPVETLAPVWVEMIEDVDSIELDLLYVEFNNGAAYEFERCATNKSEDCFDGLRLNLGGIEFSLKSVAP